MEKYNFRNGKTSIEISEEFKLETQMITFPIPSGSPFYEVFGEQIVRLLEAGICPYRLTGSLLNMKVKTKRYDEEIPALVLSMEDLGVGFEVCLIPLALSIVSFIFEVIYAKARDCVAACIQLSFT